MKNSILDTENDVADRIAQRTLAKREAGYASEVRRLLDAALEVMRQNGMAARPRVADIVAAAGLSNDAFYRHFPSKDALVAALLEDGAQRLARYVAHQMSKEPDPKTPEGQVRRWVEGVLSQTREEIAATTLAVLWNGGSIGETVASGRHSATAPLATLLRDPFARLGSPSPDLDASLAAHAVVGKISDYLWQRTTPTPADLDQITAFCLRAATSAPPSSAPPSSAPPSPAPPSPAPPSPTSGYHTLPAPQPHQPRPLPASPQAALPAATSMPLGCGSFE